MSLLENMFIPGEVQTYAAISKCFIGSLQCKTTDIGGLFRFHVSKSMLNVTWGGNKKYLSEFAEITIKYSVSML